MEDQITYSQLGFTDPQTAIDGGRMGETLPPDVMDPIATPDKLPTVAPLTFEEPEIKQSKSETQKIANKLKGQVSFFDLQRANEKALQRMGGTVKPKLTEYSVDISEVGTQLHDGTFVSKYENYIGGTDNENRLGQEQSTLEQWGNGILKNVVKTGINVLDGTVGTVYGLGHALSGGGWNGLYDNAFSHTMDDWNTKLDYQLPNYYTQEQRDKGFFGSALTANFWANDFLGGISFMAGSLISEGIWASATGGASLATSAARVALRSTSRGLTRMGARAASEVIDRTGQRLLNHALRQRRRSQWLQAGHNLRFLYTSSGYEAGVEARHSFKESLDRFKQSYENTFGRTPTAEEYQKFMVDAKKSSNLVFAANVGLVGASNIAQFGAIFGLNTNLSRRLSQAIGRRFGLGLRQTVNEAGERVYEATGSTAFRNFLGTTRALVAAPFVEGVVEEGGQAVISGMSTNWLEASYNVDAIKENYDRMKSTWDALKHTYGTSEGWKEIGIGMLIGGGGAAFSRLKMGKRLFGTSFGDLQEGFRNAADELNANQDKMTEAQLNLLNRMVRTNRINALTASAESRTDSVLASLELDEAQYERLSLEDSNDLLDDASSNYEYVIENISNETLINDYQITEEQANNYKAALIENHRKNVELYRRVKKAQEVYGLQAGTGKASANFSHHFGRTLFLGAKAGERAKEAANIIQGITRNSHNVHSIKQVYESMDQEGKKKVKRVSELRKEQERLRRSSAQLQNSFTRTAQNDSQRTEQNKGTAKKINDNAKKLEQIQNELFQNERELTQLEQELDGLYIANTFDFAGALESSETDLQTEGLLSTNDLTDAFNELQKLDQYLVKLFEVNEPLAKGLAELIGEYNANIGQMRTLQDTVEQMLDPKFMRNQEKGLAKLIGRSATGAAYTKEQYTGDTVLEELIENNKDRLNDAHIFTLRTLARIKAEEDTNTPLEIRPSDSITDEDFANYESGDAQVTNEIINRVARKLYNEGKVKVILPNNKERNDKGQFTNTFTDLYGEVELSEREAQVYREQKRKIQKEVRRIKRVMGDRLPDAANRTSRAEQFDKTTFSGKIRQKIQQIQNTQVHLDNVDVQNTSKEDIPTQKDYDAFERLSKKGDNRNVVEQTQYEKLKKKIDNWGRIQGSEEVLSVLLEQLFTVMEQADEPSRVEGEVDLYGEISTDASFDPKKRNVYHDHLQTYDQAMVTKYEDDSGVVQTKISNINANFLLEAFLNSLGESGQSTFFRNGKQINPKNGKFSEEDIKEGADVFTIAFSEGGVRQKFVFKIDRGNTLLLDPTAVQILEEQTDLYITPTSPTVSYYQPLLQRVETEDGGFVYETVDTNFEVESGYEIDKQALWESKTNKQGDSQTEEERSVYYEVSTNNKYNKKLLAKYHKAVGFEKDKIRKQLLHTMVIYARKQGSVVGMLKAHYPSRGQDIEQTNAMAKIREHAVNKVLNENYIEGQVIQLGLRTRSHRMYAGHPNLTLVETKEGKMVEVYHEITDKASQRIVNIGYLENGKAVWKDESLKGTNDFVFLTKIRRNMQNKGDRYANTKIPIIAFEFMGRRYAYPVHLKQVGTDLSYRVDEILATDISDDQKVTELNQLLVTSGASLDQYGILPGEFSQEAAEGLKKVLSSVKQYASIDSWMSDGRTPGEIAQAETRVNIRIDQTPFHSPKLQVRLKETEGFDKGFKHPKKKESPISEIKEKPKKKEKPVKPKRKAPKESEVEAPIEIDDILAELDITERSEVITPEIIPEIDYKIMTIEEAAQSKTLSNRQKALHLNRLILLANRAMEQYPVYEGESMYDAAKRVRAITVGLDEKISTPRMERISGVHRLDQIIQGKGAKILLHPDSKVVAINKLSRILGVEMTITRADLRTEKITELKQAYYDQLEKEQFLMDMNEAQNKEC